MRKLCFIMTFLLSFSFASELVEVIDGGTIKFDGVKIDGVELNNIQCHSAGIDTPDQVKTRKYQRLSSLNASKVAEASSKAKEFAISFFKANKNLEVVSKEQDLYRAYQCQITAGELDYSVELVKNGYAIVYKFKDGGHLKDKAYLEKLIAAQSEAIANQTGLWANYGDILREMLDY